MPDTTPAEAVNAPPQTPENGLHPSWWRDTPEARRLLAIEYHKVVVAEATYGLDKRQARRVRRRMGRPIPSASTGVPS